MTAQHGSAQPEAPRRTPFRAGGNLAGEIDQAGEPLIEGRWYVSELAPGGADFMDLCVAGPFASEAEAWNAALPGWVVEEQKVRLRREVERFFHARIPAGATGTIALVDLKGPQVGVCLDEHCPGLDDWDNELLWQAEELADLAADLEPVDAEVAP